MKLSLNNDQLSLNTRKSLRNNQRKEPSKFELEPVLQELGRLVVVSNCIVRDVHL